MAEGRFIWRDGRLVPWDEATVHVLSHALHYGSGVFEGIRAYRTEAGTAVFRLTDHMRRLHRSAAACMIPLEWSVEQLAAAAKQVIVANELESGYIRPIAFYDSGGLGVLPRNVRVTAMIAVWQWGAYLGDEGVQHGIRTKVSPWRRFGPAVLPQAKATGGYLNSMLAKIDAVRAGYDEAIMLSPEGDVSEGTGENLFLVEQGAVFTPPLASGCLDGITRDTVATLLREEGYRVTEDTLSLERLYAADEVFLTGTAAEVTPVREIDERPVGAGRPGPITRRAQALFADVAAARDPRHLAWAELI